MNITVRKAFAQEAQTVIRVNVAAWKTSFRGIVADDFLDSLCETNTKMYSNLIQDVQNGRCIVALQEEQIVGFCCFGPSRDQDFPQSAEIYFFYLLKDFQKKGIGHQIYEKAKCELVRSGYHSLIIECLSNNPSCHFYSSLGGKKVKEYEDEMGNDTYLNSLFYFEI